jgi:hypothetical protein
MDFKPTIEAAGKALKQSSLGRLSTFIRAWNALEWRDVQGSGDAAVNTKTFKSINLFPGLTRLSPQEQQAALLREFGISLFQQFGDDRAKRRWELKLTLPDAAQIDEVQARLRDERFKSYTAVMKSFKGLMDRYVSLNLTNALLSNGIKRQDAFNVDLRQYGCTLAYANIRKMHSLIPYVTAYGPRDVAECPGKALAEKLIFDMGHISESSLAEAYGRLITEVFMLCRAN